SAYEVQVRGVLEAFRRRGESDYTWFGEPSRRDAGDTDGSRASLQRRLRGQLYRDFYVYGAARPAVTRAWRAASGVSTAFAEGLAWANQSRGYWEGGWVFEGLRGDRIVVAKDGLALTAREVDCWFEQGVRPSLGTFVRVKMPGESFAISPGFYTAM